MPVNKQTNYRTAKVIHGVVEIIIDNQKQLMVSSSNGNPTGLKSSKIVIRQSTKLSQRYVVVSSSELALPPLESKPCTASFIKLKQRRLISTPLFKFKNVISSCTNAHFKTSIKLIINGNIAAVRNLLVANQKWVVAKKY